MPALGLTQILVVRESRPLGKIGEYLSAFFKECANSDHMVPRREIKGAHVPSTVIQGSVWVDKSGDHLVILRV